MLTISDLGKVVMTLDHLKLSSDTSGLVGNHRVNPPKSSVDHLTPQFKQTNNEAPRSARGNSSSGSVREREYITTVLRSHYKFKALKFTRLGSHT